MRSRLILLAILILFVIHCLSLNFTQDDAFISYRYAQNLIEGNGLVFNAGERVEGFTNFLWVILLSVSANLGLDMVAVSKVVGVMAGCATLLLLYQVSCLLISRRQRILRFFPSILLASSSAFAYWSISGLETSLFAMMVMVSVYGYLTAGRWWPVSCALAALIRPEGGLIFAILFLDGLLIRRERLREAALHMLEFMLPVLPFFIFRILYYGDVLPNPFYAKTGLSFEYVQSGLEYFWTFLKHYGLWGILYLVPAFFYGRLASEERLLISLVYLYTLYVIVVGGDVLAGHRFFVPVLALLYLVLSVLVQRAYAGFGRSLGMTVALSSMLFAVWVLFLLIPQKSIRGTRDMEHYLVQGMRSVAAYLKNDYGPDFSLALTTIGSASYHLGTEVRVIDMLGLTDRYIARHPEKMEGIAVTWKERKYNTGYLLSLDPDFILFSTGYKPSAPAERALLLNSKFRENYYALPMHLKQGEFIPIFKKRGIYPKDNQVFQDAGFVELFCQAIYVLYRGRIPEAIEKLKQVDSDGPQDFGVVPELLGRVYFLLRDYPAAEAYLRKAIRIDDRTVLAHAYLEAIYREAGRTAEAETEKRKVFLYDPSFRW